MLILGALMSAIFEVVGIQFCEFSGKKSRSEQTKYTTFINSSWAISERKMREINFSSMRHNFASSRLGHSLLRANSHKIQI